ncbi:hypothetical protein EJ04DRAFT_97030 [Polyplosphaeria fusca]|uniref:Uncharacterized protein n=1 Tax=Polyplosphaeria fusca TaxID=682080 RepID=A0A9P4QPG7_9PLEO|nr:hypothetical protein EJ04DRAFT_97030 [Polyplosphaeria fusca]
MLLTLLLAYTEMSCWGLDMPTTAAGVLTFRQSRDSSSRPPSSPPSAPPTGLLAGPRRPPPTPTPTSTNPPRGRGWGPCPLGARHRKRFDDLVAAGTPSGAAHCKLMGLPEFGEELRAPGRCASCERKGHACWVYQLHAVFDMRVGAACRRCRQDGEACGLKRPLKPAKSRAKPGAVRGGRKKGSRNKPK